MSSLATSHYLADIRDGFGKEILVQYLNGHKEIATPSCLRWSNHGKSPKQWQELWREAVSQSIPTTTKQINLPTRTIDRQS